MARRCWPLMQQGRLICQQGKVKPAPAISGSAILIAVLCTGKADKSPHRSPAIGQSANGLPMGKCDFACSGFKTILMRPRFQQNTVAF